MSATGGIVATKYFHGSDPAHLSKLPVSTPRPGIPTRAMVTATQQNARMNCAVALLLRTLSFLMARTGAVSSTGESDGMVLLHPDKRSSRNFAVSAAKS